MGSNVGDRLLYLRQSIDMLGTVHGTGLQELSSVYQTEPIGIEDQPRFLNAVAKITTELEPLDLLGCLQEIEIKLGRTRAQRWGPRTIDLDILAVDGLYFNSPVLSIPHPLMLKRRFVLVPFVELEPDFCVFGTRLTIQEILQRMTEEDAVHFFASKTELK